MDQPQVTDQPLLAESPFQEVQDFLQATLQLEAHQLATVQLSQAVQDLPVLTREAAV